MHKEKNSEKDNKIDENYVNCNDNNEFEFIDEQYFNNCTNFEPLINKKINFKYSQEFIKLREEKIKEEKCLEEINYRRRDSREDVKHFNKTDSPLKQELFSANYEIDYDFLEKRRDIENEIESDFDEKETQIENNKMEEIKLEEVKKVEFLSPKPKTGAEYLRDIQTGKALPHYKNMFTEEVKKFGAELNLRGEKLDSKGDHFLTLIRKKTFPVFYCKKLNEFSQD